MENVNWTHILVFGLVALVVFALGVGLLLFLSGAWGLMGTGMMGPGHMGGGFLGGVLWLLVACLFPLALLTLLVVGGIVLVRNASSTERPQQSVDRCPSCGRRTESDWQVCPYCGEDFEDEE